MYDIVFDIVFKKIIAKNISIQSSLLYPTKETIRETMICNLMNIIESKYIQFKSENRNTNEDLICYVYAEYNDYKKALHNLYQFRKLISNMSILEKNIDYHEDVFLQKNLPPPIKIKLLISSITSEMMCELTKTFNPLLFPAFILNIQIIAD